MIRVLIADDQALFREGLRKVLEANGFDVVGESNVFGGALPQFFVGITNHVAE